VSASAGDYFQQSWLGRAAAVGDLDRDGDQDLVVTHLLDPPALLRNDTLPSPRSVSVRVVGRTQARDPLGIRVAATIAGQKTVRWLPSGGSFQAASEAVVVFPVGSAEIVESIEVTWPNRVREIWKIVPATRQVQLVQGVGSLEAAQ
jgi:hypothetical protein